MTEPDVQLVVDCAGLAPSVHNTQPWQFVLREDALEIRADRSRQLSYLDPTGRQLHVSCGTAVEFARLAARSVGRQGDVKLRPVVADEDLLAVIDLTPGDPPSTEELDLAGAIARRYTDRGPYSDRPVPPEVLMQTQDRAAELGVWVRLLDRPGERTAVTLVLADGEAAEAADPQYADELARWMSAAPRPEGMPETATAWAWPPYRVSDVPLRDFSGHDRHPRPGDVASDVPPVVERATLVLLGTAADDAVSWLRAGQALGWLMLRCTADGLSAQPLGQAIDLPAARNRLAHELGLVGRPQFLLRLGYGYGRPRTQRRNPDSTSLMT